MDIPTLAIILILSITLLADGLGLIR